MNRRAAAREAAAEADYPPTGQIITVGGKRVHAEVFGRGPDLVLIHGASGNTRDWTFDIVARLQDRFRVIVFDRPGLGWSDDLGLAGLSPIVQAEVLRTAAAELGASKPIVLGHSYGGAVAMAWALSAPNAAAALVLAAGATMPWHGGLGPWYAITSSRIGGATVIPLITALAPLRSVETAIESIFTPDPVPSGYGHYVGAALTLRRRSMRTNARQVDALKPWIIWMAQGYPGLNLPVEILHGTKDSIVPHLVHAEPLSRLLPDANLTLLPGAGHMPHHSRQPELIAAIDRAAVRAGLR